MVHRIEPRGWTMARRPLTRAEFLKILAAGAGGVAFLRGSEDALAAIAGADDDLDQAALDGDATRGAGVPYMTVAHGSPADALVKTAIAKIGGMRRFVGNGDDVVIKPNICAAREPQVRGDDQPGGHRDAGETGARRRREPGAGHGQPDLVEPLELLLRQRDRRRGQGGGRLHAGDERLPLQDVRHPGRHAEAPSGVQGHGGVRRPHQRPHRQAARLDRTHAGRQEPHGLHQRPRPHAQPGAQPHDRGAERLSEAGPDGARRDPHPGAATARPAAASATSAARTS